MPLSGRLCGLVMRSRLAAADYAWLWTDKVVDVVVHGGCVLRRRIRWTPQQIVCGDVGLQDGMLIVPCVIGLHTLDLPWLCWCVPPCSKVHGQTRDLIVWKQGLVGMAWSIWSWKTYSTLPPVEAEALNWFKGPTGASASICRSDTYSRCVFAYR
ncbi:hypothetical protein V8C44DRAFT_315050 [Trichoderma aethiopicum]